MSTNKVEKAIKRKKSMVIQIIKWIISGIVIGFFITLGTAIFEAYKTGFSNTLANLVTNYFNLILEIANRNPTFANLILHDQALAEAQVYQGLGNSNAFISSHFATLSNGREPSGQLSAVFNNLKYHVCGLLYLAEWSFKLDLIKFVSVFCSFMVYVFAGFLGLLDGLLVRYIRTAEGGRESAYVYHHLADALFKIPFCLIIAYLALPFPLNPLIVVVILAMTTFLFCRVSTSNLKKFI